MLSEKAVQLLEADGKHDRKGNRQDVGGETIA